MTENEACELELVFQPDPDGSTLVLTSATLDIGSNCPGFSDADEGVYRWRLPARAEPVAWLDLSEEQAVAGARGPYAGCVTADLRPTGVVELARGNLPGVISLDLAQIQISGGFDSQGADDECCPGDGCELYGLGGAAGL